MPPKKTEYMVIQIHFGHSDSLRSVSHCWCLIDNMFPVWALNFLILKYTLGFPIRNITSSEFDDLNLNITNSSEFDDLNLNITNSSEFDDLNLNITNSSEFDDLNLNITNSSEFDDLNLNLTNRFNPVQNITYYLSPNQKNISFQVMNIPTYSTHGEKLFHPGIRRTGCYVFSCITQELGHRIQTGDETAGESARDAHGPGKK